MLTTFTLIYLAIGSGMAADAILRTLPVIKVSPLWHTALFAGFVLTCWPYLVWEEYF